jgi:hypothetical protein
MNNEAQAPFRDDDPSNESLDSIEEESAETVELSKEDMEAYFAASRGINRIITLAKEVGKLKHEEKTWGTTTDSVKVVGEGEKSYYAVVFSGELPSDKHTKAISVNYNVPPDNYEDTASESFSLYEEAPIISYYEMVHVKNGGHKRVFEHKVPITKAHIQKLSEIVLKMLEALEADKQPE